jgi:hypothetical protein
MGETFVSLLGPEQNHALSTGLAHSRSRATTRLHAVVPVVHTPYDYDERFLNS